MTGRAASLTIPREVLEEILDHARTSAPEEVCGWIAGKENRALAVYPIPNVSPNPRTSFEMDPTSQLRTMKAITASGQELTGTYHSHPGTPPVPSRQDRSLALYPESVHLISSLLQPQAEICCYRITRTGYTRIELVIEARERNPGHTMHL